MYTQSAKKFFLAFLCLHTTCFAEDIRLSPLKDLNGYFPFITPASSDAWEERSEAVQRRVLVSQGLWPSPTKTSLNPVIHGTIEVADEHIPGGAYTISKVYFESLPGFFVTGNLYRPKYTTKKVPGVLFSHGHKKDARLALESSKHVREEIASGAERFEHGGRSLYQSMCVQLVRMGCIVWQWDMLGDSDSQQLSRQLVHGFVKQRPEMNQPDHWGFFSPQAENRLQNVMGLQTWNSIRSLDFLLSLPEVDPSRIAMTGSSGGGTQTMLLAAVDDRLALSFPVVMVSTSMQGGCTCENASLLRIGTGNVELAALFAPKPQGMNTADDWTKELATKGFPDLQNLYRLLNAEKNIMLLRGEHFPHNYNAVTRSAFHSFLNKEFGLGFPSPVIERDFIPLPSDQLTVWDAQHPAPPAADPEFECRLLKNLAQDIDHKIRTTVKSKNGVHALLDPAFDVLIGRTSQSAGDVSWQLENKYRANDHIQMTGLLLNTTYKEQVSVQWLYPTTWNGDVIIWLDSSDSTLLSPDHTPTENIQKFIDRGVAVMTAKLFHMTDESRTESSRSQQRTVDSPREFAGYTFGYNHPSIVRSVHDVLSIIAFLRNAKVKGHPRPNRVLLAGLEEYAPIVLATRAVSELSVDKTFVDTDGFRFATLDDWRHPLFLPGAVRYLDIPGFIAAGKSTLLLAGEESDSLLPVTRDDLDSEITLLTKTPDRHAEAIHWFLSED